MHRNNWIELFCTQSEFAFFFISTHARADTCGALVLGHVHQPLSLSSEGRRPDLRPETSATPCRCHHRCHWFGYGRKWWSCWKRSRAKGCRGRGQHRVRIHTGWWRRASGPVDRLDRSVEYVVVPMESHHVRMNFPIISCECNLICVCVVCVLLNLSNVVVWKPHKTRKAGQKMSFGLKSWTSNAIR